MKPEYMRIKDLLENSLNSDAPARYYLIPTDFPYFGLKKTDGKYEVIFEGC